MLAECQSGGEAVDAIKRLKPGLVFLDIQMPGMDGFTVIKQLDPSQLPIIIFVTAYDQHALKAFEVHALDYLLKPFKQERFRQAIQQVREKIHSKQSSSLPQSLLDMLAQAAPGREYVTRIAVRNGERVVFVKADRIEFIESAGNYAVLHVGKETHRLFGKP